MTYTGVYIDDDTADHQLYADAMNTASGERVLFSTAIGISDPATLARSILESSPDIVALDYRLDEDKTAHGGANTFRAGGLAQMLREAKLEDPDHDFPIVLVSTEDKIRNLFRPDQTAHDLFDEWYRKEKLVETPERIGSQLLTLVDGYKLIDQCRRSTNKHLSLLGLSEDGWNEISPKSLKISLEETDVPHVIARTILRLVVRRTGLLLSPEEVCARLAISAGDGKSAAVFAYFSDVLGMRYDGVFGGGWSRVWRHKLEQWAAETFKRSLASVPGKERIGVVSEMLKAELVPAVSKWTGKTDGYFAFSCSSCHNPTELRHSVAAHDPEVPNFGERKRICFSCIETDAYQADFFRIDGDDEDVANDVRNGLFPRE